MIVSESAFPFVECATFADEIKLKGYAWQSNWHFKNTPYLEEGGSLNDFPDFHEDPNSVEKAIPDIARWLAGEADYTTTFVYETLKEKMPQESEEVLKSFALRLLIHYVGDLH
jgi:hypothetical protein